MQVLRLDRVLDTDGDVEVDYQYVGDTQNANLVRPEICGTGGQLLVDYVSSWSGYYGQTYDVRVGSSTERRGYAENWARDVLWHTLGGVLQTSFSYVGCNGQPGSYASQRLITQWEDAAASEVTTYTYDIVANGVPPYYSGYSTPSDHFRQGNCIRVDHVASGQFETYTYGGGVYNHLVSSTDVDGGVTTYQHDGHGNVTWIYYPDQSVAHYVYDEYGGLLYIEWYTEKG